jgi:TonB family protein
MLCAAELRPVRQSMHRPFAVQAEVNMQFATEPPPIRQAKQRLPAILFSIALHGSVLAFALQLGIAARTKVIAPASFRTQMLVEHVGASHAARIPLPTMETAPHTRNPAPNTEATRKTILPVEAEQQRLSGGGAPKDPHAGNGSGLGLRGSGDDAEDAQPAFPIFSPHPSVTERSLLPATEEKVVVDVKVDALGAVVGETLVQGVGNQLDQIVLDVVRTWRFQPATVNGKPVPAEAELIFPFNTRYPISDS